MQKEALAVWLRGFCTTTWHLYNLHRKQSTVVAVSMLLVHHTVHIWPVIHVNGKKKTPPKNTKCHITIVFKHLENSSSLLGEATLIISCQEPQVYPEMRSPRYTSNNPMKGGRKIGNHRLFNCYWYNIGYNLLVFNSERLSNCLVLDLATVALLYKEHRVPV